MAELTPEQDAFLRQRMPEAYAPVREPVVYVRDWLSIKRMINAAPEPDSARLELFGLPDPVPGVPIADLQNVVRKACQAISLDPGCVEAYILVTRAVVQLSSYDELTVHQFPLRDVLQLAQRGRQVGDKSPFAWAALLEVNIHLKRWDIVTEQLAQYKSRNLDPLLGARLSLLSAKAQGLLVEQVQWYDRLLALTPTSAERAELHGRQALAYVGLKQIELADAAFHRALVEGGPLGWVAHEWSKLKDTMGERPAAIELNRRACGFEGDNRAAKVYAETLRAPFRRFGHPFPGPAALAEEKTRGIALAGCDPAVVAAEKLKPYEQPKSVTRALTRRLRRQDIEKKGPADLVSGQGGISLARSLTPEDVDSSDDDTAVGTGYLQQLNDPLERVRAAEKDKAEKPDQSGLLVPRDAEVAPLMPNSRTIRDTSLKPKVEARGPSPATTRIVRRPPPASMIQALPGPMQPVVPPEEKPAEPQSGTYVRPATGQFKRPSTGAHPALKPPTSENRKPSTGAHAALKPSAGEAPKPDTRPYLRPPAAPPLPPRISPIPVLPILPRPAEPAAQVPQAALPEAAPAPALPPEPLPVSAPEPEVSVEVPEPPREPPASS